MLLGCQRKLAYSKPSLTPAGCQDVLGRRDFGHEGGAVSLDHLLGEAVSHLQNRICFANPRYPHQFFVLVFFSKPIYDQYFGWGKPYRPHVVIYQLSLKLDFNNVGESWFWIHI